MHDASAKSFSAQAVPGVDGAIWATSILDQRSPGKIYSFCKILFFSDIIPNPLFLSDTILSCTQTVHLSFSHVLCFLDISSHSLIFP